MVYFSPKAKAKVCSESSRLLMTCSAMASPKVTMASPLPWRLISLRTSARIAMLAFSVTSSWYGTRAERGKNKTLWVSPISCCRSLRK